MGKLAGAPIPTDGRKGRVPRCKAARFIEQFCDDDDRAWIGACVEQGATANGVIRHIMDTFTDPGLPADELVLMRQHMPARITWEAHVTARCCCDPHSMPVDVMHHAFPGSGHRGLAS